jgi:hypothetical protein
MEAAARAAARSDRVRRAEATARRHGYALTVQPAPAGALYTHTAVARSLRAGKSEPHLLTYATSEADAASLGLTILLSVLRGDDLWPEP